MVRKKLVLSLLAVMLAAPGIHAQTAPAAAAAPAAANAIDPGSIQALKDMGAHLQSLKRFQVKTELTGERVLVDGQKLQHMATAEMDIQRPNMLRARMFSTRSEREIFYDGKVATLFIPMQKAYSTVDFTGNLDDLVTILEERYGVEIPLSDLFLWGTPAAPVDRITSAMAGNRISRSPALQTITSLLPVGKTLSMTPRGVPASVSTRSPMRSSQ